MTIPAAAPTAPAMVAFRPIDTVVPPPGLFHGQRNTLEIQRYLTPIKIEFSVPGTQTAFNLNKSHHAVLKLLQAKDPTLEIVPSKEGKAQFSDLLQFPANENDYNALFAHAVDKQPTTARKVIVAHSLVTTMKFSDLKFQNAPLMAYLLANKAFLQYNKSETLQTAALGFFQRVHPRVTHRDDFAYDLAEAIHLEMTDAERAKIATLVPTTKKRDHSGEVEETDLKLEIVTRTIGFGNGAGRLKTDAYEVCVPLAIRLEIKEILIRLGSKDLIPDGRFIPYGLAQTAGTEVYKNMLRLQNIYLGDFRLVPVFGLTHQALDHVINVDFTEDGNQRPMTVREFILMQPGIKRIESTNRSDDLGKQFLISDAAGILQARAFVDTVIKQLYESGNIPTAYILEQFNPPRRGDAPRTTAHFQSYAATLANLGNPQEDVVAGGGAPPPRPPKRTVQVVYDLQGGDFPNLPKRKNPAPAEAPQHPVTPQGSPVTQPPPVTQTSLAQLREELKREIMTMIATEVKTQIQAEMSAIRSEVANLASKFDTMSSAIKESIGTSIRAAIRATLLESTTPLPSTQPQTPRGTPAASYYQPHSEHTEPSNNDADMHEPHEGARSMETGASE